MEGFSAAHVRVVASARDGDHAFVVLDTGVTGAPYLYGGTVHRIAGRWHGGSDSNGGAVSWSRTDEAGEVGVVALWDEARPGANAVRVRWRGAEREVPVQFGVFLAVWWREPWPEDEWPALVAIRVNDRWIAP
jgi:hypothetical protein